MKNKLKNVLLLLFSLSPLYILNSYTKTVYQYSLSDYWQWLISSSGHSYFEFDEFLVSVVLVLICLCWIALFINGVLTKILATEQVYIYLGNSKVFYGNYFAPQGLDKSVKTAISETEYNTGFDNIGRIQSFTKNKQDQASNTLGKTSQQFSFGSSFTNLIIMLLFFIPLMGSLHACFEAMATDHLIANGNPNVFVYEWKVSFEKVLAPMGLSVGKLFLLWSFTLLLMFVFLSKFPRQAFGERYIPLPSSIYIGAKLTALPIAISVVSEDKTVDEFGKKVRRYLSTSKRNVTFEFDDLYKWPVYVTAVIDLSQCPDLEAIIQENIETKQRMEVKLNKNLKAIIQT